MYLCTFSLRSTVVPSLSVIFTMVFLHRANREKCPEMLNIWKIYNPNDHIPQSPCATKFSSLYQANGATDTETEQESSAKLTNQRISYAFTSSPLSFHARYILPTSKFQHCYSCILLIFLQTSVTVNGMCEN